MSAIESLTATLRNIIGDLELDHTLTSRDFINSKITTILDESADRWGHQGKPCGSSKILFRPLKFRTRWKNR